MNVQNGYYSVCKALNAAAWSLALWYMVWFFFVIHGVVLLCDTWCGSSLWYMVWFFFVIHGVVPLCYTWCGSSLWYMVWFFFVIHSVVPLCDTWCGSSLWYMVWCSVFRMCLQTCPSAPLFWSSLCRSGRCRRCWPTPRRRLKGWVARCSHEGFMLTHTLPKPITSGFKRHLHRNNPHSNGMSKQWGYFLFYQTKSLGMNS